MRDGSTLGDKNEAAGAAAGRAFRTIEQVALVAEKGVLCDHTYAADARGTRAPYLLGNNDPFLPARGGIVPPARAEAARSSGT